MSNGTLTAEQTIELIELMRRYSLEPVYGVAKIDYSRKQGEIKYGGTEYNKVWIDEQDNIHDAGQTTMTGMQYVNKTYGLNYKHLRTMMQIIQLRNGGGGITFDIDQRFGYRANALATFIKEYYSADEINSAHIEALSNYRKGRGRPKGSRNKAHVMSDAVDSVIDSMSTDEIADELRDDTENRANDVLKKHIESGVDIVALLAPYVTHNQLAKKDYINSGQMINAVAQMQNALETWIKAEIATINLQKPTVVEIKRNEFETIQMGTQHRNFPTLLTMCNASLRNGSHLNVWVYGPAGTGKSTAAEKCAEALSLNFYTNGKLATDFQVLGYKDANGTYQTTQFRQAFEFGGIYLADEIDGSMPDALLALNGALANGHCAFPDKVVTRHANFIFVAAANTTGTGATIDYVGRYKQDAAFNDRFVFLDWPLDEALEDSLVANKDWLRAVRKVRSNIATKGIKGHLITPRASIYGESLLAAGLDMQIVVNSVLKKGLSDAQWQQVKH